MEKSFSKLQRGLSTELIASNSVNIDQLVETLTLLPIALRTEYQRIIKENLSDISRATNIRQIFHYLNPHLTFIDYGLLEHLIEHHGSNTLKRDMSKYIDEVQKFMEKTTVEQLIDSDWPSHSEIPPHLQELRALIDEDPKKYTLKKLNTLRKSICAEVSLSETVLMFIGVARRSSFILSLAIPSILLSKLNFALGSLGVFYEKVHILSITVGKQCLYFVVVRQLTCTVTYMQSNLMIIIMMFNFVNVCILG